MLPIALDVTDPPRRTEDKRPLADRGIGYSGAVCVPNESNNLHCRYRSSQGSQSILTTISLPFQAASGRGRIDSIESARLLRPGYPLPIIISVERSCRRQRMTMDMTTMGSGALVAMAVYHIAIFIFAVLGIAASIKYLRS
jgi:hypothetical protein